MIDLTPAPIGEDGRALRRTDTDDDGEVVPDHVLQQSGLIGAIRLLEEIARKDDSPKYRRAARAQADVLKRVVRRTRHGALMTDAEILGTALQELADKPRKLATGGDVLEIEAKEIR